MMVMAFKRKKYIGGISDEIEAAKVYDRYALLGQGPQVSR